MVTRRKLTKTLIESLSASEDAPVFWDTNLSGFGLRVSPKGRKSYLLQFRDGKSAHKSVIGTYPDLTPEMAREKALERKRQVLSGEYAKQKAITVTFADIMNGYVDTLFKRQKRDAKNVSRTINLHIRDAFPQLWKKPALDIESADCINIVKRLIAQEKLRTADFVRIYMHTAFNMATKADPNIAESMPHLKMSNPALMKPVEGAIKARERHLSEQELRAFWGRVQALPFPKKEIISLWILTGGQRQQQLARVQAKDIQEVNIPNRDGFTKGMEVIDTKGRTARERKHFVPLTPKSKNLVDALLVQGPFIFSTTGQEGVEPNWFGRQIKPIVKDMEAAGELDNGSFTAGAIRSTVETLLGKYGVSREDRGHLQSHGNSGVQAKHYDRHDYAGQKLTALEIWESLLDA